ncbi:MAG: hypothetical protein K8H89_15990 [Flavobacteriales bacterium]|jgi:hypothetical protein|nr:hypothetical protein [Flavobacteriales bacterium]MCB0758305.1 hypothetical protein [Flavobacteriales bacterium]
MHSKLALLLAFSVLAFVPAHAQKKTDKADVKWGADMTIKDNGKFRYVIGDVDNSSFIVVRRKKDVLIQRMDGVKVAWQKPVDLELDEKDLSIHTIILTKTDILVFCYYYDKKDNETRLYLSSYDQASFMPLKHFEKVATIPALKSSNTGAFIISSSPDRSKVLVQVLPPFDKEDLERSSMNVYDADMQLQWSQEFSLPYTDADYRVESQRVDNDGSVLVLGVKYADRKEKKALKRANKSTYEYHLLVYTGDSPTPQDHAIAVQDKFLQDMSLSMADQGDIICAGLFGNKGSFSVRGAFFLRLDRTTKTISHESFKEFSDDFITSYMTEKQAQKAKKKAEKQDQELELPEFVLHDIIHRDDGGAVLIAEQYFMRVVTTTSSTPNGGTTTSTTYHYYYNDVVVVNIDPQGNIEWATKVPKRQHSINDDGIFSSCAVAVKGGKIYLVFNDTGENLFVKPGDKIKQFELKGKDALVILATIGEDGNVSREALFTPDRRDVILRPQDCVQLKDDTMFIYASRYKDYRFGLIEFK